MKLLIFLKNICNFLYWFLVFFGLFSSISTFFYIFIFKERKSIKIMSFYVRYLTTTDNFYNMSAQKFDSCWGTKLVNFETLPISRVWYIFEAFVSSTLNTSKMVCTAVSHNLDWMKLNKQKLMIFLYCLGISGNAWFPRFPAAYKLSGCGNELLMENL